MLAATMRRVIYFAALSLASILLMVAWMNMIESLSRDSLRVPALYITQGPRSAHNTSAGVCAWKCGGGLRMLTRRAERNLYVLDSDDSLDGAVDEWNDLLQCVAYEQKTRDSQEPDTSVCDSQAYARNDTPQQTVRRAIEKKNIAQNQYFEITKLEPRILSLALAWKSLGEASWRAGSLPVRDYYPPRDVTQLCTAKYKCATGNGSMCEEQFISALPAQCEENFHVLGQTTTSLAAMEQLDLDEYPLHMHIIHGGTVNKDGNVRVGQTEVIPQQCKLKAAPMAANTAQHVREVFVISQFWGEGYYHAPIEDFPRLAAYLPFLKTNPEIKIHAAAKFLKDYLPVVGLDPGRLVFGQMTADVIYLPQGGGCGWLHPISGQLLHQHYSRYIHQHLSPNPLQTPATILLIQRSSKRWLAQHAAIESLLRELAPPHNLSVEVYSDKELPGFNATVAMFSRARLVLAPHGAGLSNTMFSPTGTRIIEVLCNPGLNYCYRTLSSALGNPYVGLLSLRQSKSEYMCGGLTVDMNYLKLLIQTLLD